MGVCTFCGNNEYIEKKCNRCGEWPGLFTSSQKIPYNLGLFVMDSNHFEYKKNKYNYQDIKHITFDSLESKTYMSTMPIWQSEKQELHIDLGDKGVIKEKGKAWSGWNEKLVDITSAYRYLSEITFVNRFNSYANSVNTKGCFIYDGCKFFTDGHIETRKNNNINLSDYKINDHESFIELTPREPTIIEFMHN
jgi:hypothetical protein